MKTEDFKVGTKVKFQILDEKESQGIIRDIEYPSDKDVYTTYNVEVSKEDKEYYKEHCNSEDQLWINSYEIKEIIEEKTYDLKSLKKNVSYEEEELSNMIEKMIMLEIVEKTFEYHEYTDFDKNEKDFFKNYDKEFFNESLIELNKKTFNQIKGKAQIVNILIDIFKIKINRNAYNLIRFLNNTEKRKDIF